MTLGFLNGPTPTWVTLLIAFLAPSAIKATLDLFNSFRQKSVQSESASGGKELPKTVFSSNERIFLALKESNFLKPGTVEHKIDELVARGKTLSRQNFLEKPDYWQDRYQEKCNLLLSIAGLFGTSGAIMLSLLLNSQPSAEGYWMLLLATGFLLGCVPLLLMRYRTFAADVRALRDFSDWRERYGISVELAFLQTREGAQKLQAEAGKHLNSQ